jgi:hypothetical protein
VGIREAAGDIVAFLDGDDWWAPGKLDAVLAAFEQNPGIAAVGHGYFEVHGDSPPTEMLLPARTCLLDLSSVEAARVADLGRMLLGTSRLAVRREFLARVGPIPTELVFCADTPIYSLALALGGALILDQPLCYYRLHAGNLSARGPGDKARQSQNYEILKFLLALLSQRLADLGVKQEVISAFFEADRLGLERFELQRDGGGRWQAFRTEMRALRSEYRTTTAGYKVFKGIVGALALALPPQRFYDLRDWYSHRGGMHRLRGVVGKAEPIVPQSLFQRRPVAAGEK